MLVLTRRIGEEIVIDGHIRVVVLKAQNDSIRLGISAPPSMSVDRKEIHERRFLEKPPETCEAGTNALKFAPF